MDTPKPRPRPDRFLYRAIILYVIIHVLCFLFRGASPSSEVFSLWIIRVPGMALLLLILSQVIFPEFRCSKLPNIVAVLAILALTVGWHLILTTASAAV